MTSEQESWMRAKALYGQVLSLGLTSPHRADALYSLGWIEYRMANYPQSRNHFECFLQQFPDDTRCADALAISAIAKAEESLGFAKRLIVDDDLQMKTIALVKFEEMIKGIERDVIRVQNRAYRKILEELGSRACLLAIPVLEEFGEYFRVDFLWSQLRRILAFSAPEKEFCEMISEVIYSHAVASKVGPGDRRRRERATYLLRKVTADLSRPYQSEKGDFSRHFFPLRSEDRESPYVFSLS